VHDPDRKEVEHDRADDVQIINDEVLLIRSRETGTVAVYGA
jgi:hypothetical protein